jgi:uncharacterized coiled-coil protein SlyX
MGLTAEQVLRALSYSLTHTHCSEKSHLLAHLRTLQLLKSFQRHGKNEVTVAPPPHYCRFVWKNYYTPTTLILWFLFLYGLLTAPQSTTKHFTALQCE